MLHLVNTGVRLDRFEGVSRQHYHVAYARGAQRRRRFVAGREGTMRAWSSALAALPKRCRARQAGLPPHSTTRAGYLLSRRTYKPASLERWY